jgi:hypothetical protein
MIKRRVLGAMAFMARTENIARMLARPHSSGNGSGPPVVSNVGPRPETP